MSRRAWAFIWGILLTGLIISAGALIFYPPEPAQFYTFIVLTVFASCAQLFKAEAPNHQTYYATCIFIFAALVLLSPSYFVLLVAIAYAIEWAKERAIKSPLFRKWYLQPFNIATIIVSGLVAREILLWLNAQLTFGENLPSWIVALTASALGFVLLNHLIIGLALVMARGISFKQSGLLHWENLLTEFVLSAMGYLVAILWQINFWLIVPALLPLVLMYRALRVPLLEHEAQTDGKTGLWNARHFATLLASELNRATRFQRPFAFIMSDLDLLRNINNTYGHLAGDAVLAEIGRIIRNTIREYDIAARFGGEEFAIALPEADLDEAMTIAERLRTAVETAEFRVATSPKPIHATMSFGVACFPVDGASPTELIHNADLAVYQAKLQGRNRVVSADQVPHSLKIEIPSFEEYPASGHYSVPPRQTEQAPKPVRPVARQKESPAPGETAGPMHHSALFPLFVGSVITTGTGLTVFSFAQNPQLDQPALALLATLALAAQFFQINLYDASGVSVALALNLAAALTAGVPGVAVVAGAMAIGDRLALVRERRFRWQPALYKTPFNWATYVLSGSSAALALRGLGLAPEASNVLPLIVFAAAAGLACYGIETGLVAAAIGLEAGSSISAVWRGRFQWLFSHYLVLCLIGLMLALALTSFGLPGATIFILPLAMMRYTQKRYVDRTEENMSELRRMNEELVRANSMAVEASRAVRQLNDELFTTLSKIIDARDPYVSNHACKVADYATAIATELGLEPGRIEQLRQAALLHDIGKIGISEMVLHKPRELTPEEYRYVQAHVTLGAEFLETSHGLRQLAPFVRHHHEWWDGSGYPAGLAGEATPLEARLLAVADAVEAMASDRPYHRAMTLREILQELQRYSGSQFDPLLVEVFMRIAEREGAALVVNSAREAMRKNGHARTSGRPAMLTVEPSRTEVARPGRNGVGQP